LKYSPKFAKILANIKDENNVGLNLLYSNFRTIEGVGILKLVLEENGFAEFKLRKKGSSWEIEENELDVNKPKFVLYTGTESTEEKEIIRNVYNSTWELVPPSILKKLKQKNNVEKNLYGAVIKLLMITSSGAEGINLKNTRYVHIVEPYWNMVRLQQVIGRARRICSHEDLPITEQNIKIFIYLTVFSDEQKTDENHIELRLRDVSKKDGMTPVTTDESLYELAEKKEIINQQILTAVKSSAIDCKLFNKSNSSKENYLCYTFGKVQSDQFLSVPDIAIDIQNTNIGDENFIQKTKLIYRKTTINLNGSAKEYYVDTKLHEIYDITEIDNAKANNYNEDVKPLGKIRNEINGKFEVVLY
jgi:hypothetical protein